ncbi:5'/3'-nucleotidase SurE [Thiorhodovibrio frisius]|uniref:5'-nucleotidase SurE n=1 Tax=Thiorhodovibrio frisius TaxID=631362 RepID=H8Z3D4_9GAMM|nr:5'/3'-nucleotidase SurE [Thiorhodovibrio frisius]EIC21842.1 5''/3''-nucleotidase SurE [Thiorhodovibrio frisius]WPL21810.1 5'-nucleotidase SurE [Thiorhodovibrio frisius]
MNILLSNDDGYRSPGLHALAGALSRYASVTVVAPDRDRSGASHSLTLDTPVRAERVEPGLYRVFGTPTDCVHLALSGLLESGSDFPPDPAPDLVVAGINHGPNLGDDVIYSGTVAAATEGRFLGLPAVAVSSSAFEPRHLDTAAEIAARLVARLGESDWGTSAAQATAKRNIELPEQWQAALFQGQMILNLNIPDLPATEINGLRATRLGNRHKSEPMIRAEDPRGRPVYWVGPPGPEQDAGEGTDFAAVRDGYISVTPLQVDLTRHSAVAALDAWLEGLR